MGSRIQKAGSRVAAWWYHRTGSARPGIFEPREPGRPDDWPASLPFRKRPKPYSRAIPWAPDRPGAVHDRSRPFELFVAQSVMRDLRAHLVTSASVEPYGFLLGQVVYCPWTSAPYIVVDAVRRETQSLPSSDELDRFRRSWAGASREARRRRGQVIGWYHRHGVLGLRLSEWDLRLQEEFFPEPWHCALIIASGPKGIVGGFIQRAARARLFRKGRAPFYELVDLDAKLIDGRRPSVIDWVNYHTDENVEVIRADWPTAARRRRWGAGEGPPPEERPEAVEEPTPEVADGPAKRRAKSKQKAARKPTQGAGASAAVPSDATPPDGADDDFWAEFSAAVGTAGGVRPAEEPPEPPVAEVAERPAEGTERPAAATERPAAELETAGNDAIWGPLRESDASRESARRRGARRVGSRSSGNGLPSLDPPEPILVTGFAPDAAFPLETDETDPRESSVEWLVSLVGETLRGSKATAPAGDAGADTEAEVRAEAEASGVRTESEAEAARPPSRAAAEAEEATATAETAPASARPSPSAQPPVARAAPPTEGRRQTARSIFIGRPSSDPDLESEAEIPVVMPVPERSPIARFLAARGSRVILVLVLAVSSVAAWLLLRPGPPGAPEPPPSVRPAPPASVAESARLSRALSDRLSAYRERSADFELGRLDCAGLTAGFEAVEEAFLALSGHVAGSPGTAAGYTRLAAEANDARQHFQRSGCSAPDAGTGADSP